jgi:N6-L-threonylcarbamoyladenine synthase
MWDIPLYPINHMEGHVITGLLTHTDSVYEIAEPELPALSLLISGGHTEFVRIPRLRSYKIIGATKDDAVGEAFDKVARLLGLPYPGGPEISRLAELARGEQCVIPDEFKLPRPMLHSGDLAMSFSGLKTAVMTRAKKYESLSDEQKKILALSFENAVADVLVAKTKQALYESGAQTLIIGGGVSANTHIRNQLKLLTQEEGVALYIPDKKLSGDNGLMIAATALLHIHHDVQPVTKCEAKGSWKIETA